MVAFQDLCKLFDNEADDYTNGQACVDASGRVQRWCTMRGWMKYKTQRYYTSSTDYQVRTVDGVYRQHFWRLCTRKFSYTGNGMWIEEPAHAPVMVVYGVMHQLIEVVLNTGDVAVFDLSVRQFVTQPGSVLTLYL